jgi:hypothetical protein
MRFKLAGGLFATVALVVTSLIGASAVQAAPPGDDWLPGIPDSASLGSPIIAKGTVAKPDGRAFANGAQVALFVYPAAEVSDALVEGEGVTSTPIAKTTTTPGGNFQLRIENASELARYASEDGIVDFEIRALEDEYYAPFAFSRQLVNAGAATLLVDPTFTPSDSLTTAESARAVANTPIEITSLPANTTVADLGAIVGESTGIVNKTDVCGETYVQNLGSKNVLVGATYTTVAGTSAKFTYTSGASSNLGVGYSVSGSYGSYSKSGTIARSSTSTIDFATRSGSYYYSSYFNYGKYSFWCYPVGQPNAKTIYSYKVRANAFNGGSSVGATSAPSATYCVKFGRNSSMTKDTSTAVTWSTGASLNSSIGINLTTQTGYTSAAKLTYTNSSSTDRQLCGTNGYPGNSPQRIVAKP